MFALDVHRRGASDLGFQGAGASRRMLKQHREASPMGMGWQLAVRPPEVVQYSQILLLVNGIMQPKRRAIFPA